MPIDVAIERDPKGLYKKALAGELKGFTGISPDSPYEEPVDPEIYLPTHQLSVDQSCDKIMDILKEKGYLR